MHSRRFCDISTFSVNCGEQELSLIHILSSEAKVLPAGTVIHTEQAKIRKELPQYQEMAERAGVFFFFEDEDIPNADVYKRQRYPAGR